MPTPTTQIIKKPQVRRYDFDAQKYTTERWTVPDFRDLVPVLQEKPYGRIDSRGLVAWMEDNGLTVREAFRALGYDPRTIGGVEARAVVTDDNQRPWFGPYIVEGFELGMNAVLGDWEDLIARTIPVDRDTVEWF